MKKRNSLAVILWAVLLASFLCPSGAAANIPTPSESFYVYDEAGVIPDDTEKHIVDQNDRLFYSTGAQIVIAAVKTTGEETIRDFAGDMFTEWKIGDAEKNNGVLVLLAIDDDDYWVTQGSGIEDKLTSGDIKVMLDNCLEPYFAAKDYGKGVLTLFDKLTSTFEDIYDVTLSNVVLPEGGIDPTGQVEANAGGGIVSAILTTFIVIVAIVVFIVIIIVIARSMPAGHYRHGHYRPTVIIPPRGGRPHVRRSPGPRPGGMAPRPGPRPGGMGGPRPGGMRPGSTGTRPGSMNRPGGGVGRSGGMGGSRPRSGGGGGTRGGGAGRR